MKPEIAYDIEMLVLFVRTMAPFGNPIETANYKRAADRVEAYLATYDPNNQ